MVSKSRVPMQVAPAFEQKIKKLQAEIMKKQGKIISLRDLTEKFANISDFEILEKKILGNDKQNDLILNLDRRRRRK